MPTFTLSIPGGRIGNFLAGAAVASVIGGTAVAITSPNFTYTATQTGFYSIHPMALAPDANNAIFVNLYDQGELLSTNANCYSTGVNLPQGSRITELIVWFQSPATPSESNPTAFLRRLNLTDGTSAPLVSEFPPIVDNSNQRKFEVLPIIGGSSLVSNIGFAYGFGFCPGQNGAFLGARIKYTFTSAGD